MENFTDLLCPECNTATLSKAGKRETKSKGNVQRYYCSECKHTTSDPVVIEETIDNHIRTKVQKQKFQDKTRVANKDFREVSRIYNAVEELNNTTVDILSKDTFTKFTKYHVDKRDGKGGVIQIGDWHGNEEVNLKSNVYNFDVLSKRAQKLAHNAIPFFKMHGVKSIFLASTGDMINSDRRLDESTTQSYNRVSAFLCVADILKSLILDLNGAGFNVYFGGVCGNESRVHEEMGFSDVLVTNNYDYAIYNILQEKFKGSKGVTFIQGDPKELVVNVNGQNILVIHGEEAIFNGDVEKGTTRLIGKYANMGVIIDFVLFGHLHYARIGENFARNSSMVGSNGYSDRALHLISKASQNLHVVEKDGMHSIKIDLQSVKGYKGYAYNKRWIAYNSQADRQRALTTIYKVVI